MFKRVRVPAALAALLIVPMALAQDEGEPAPPPVEDLPAGESSPAFPAWAPSWTTPAAESVHAALCGAWISTSTVPGADEGSAATIVLLIHPAPVEGLADTFYMEAYRSDDPANPYRQSFLQVYDAGGKARMRSFELNFPAPRAREIGKPVDMHGVLDGMGLAPEAFPRVTAADLVATQDFDLTIGGSGVSGKTPHPYPTAQGGAFTMTSEFNAAAGTLTTADRGFGADGSVVWGAGNDTAFEFRRGEPHIKVTRRSNGLIMLDMKTVEGTPIVDGGMLHVHYAGWLADGFMFDTSRQPGREVFNFPYPPRLIEAWNTGLDGMTTGSVRKLVCPAPIAYGERGQPRAEIPANATLYFTVEAMLAQPPAPAPTPEDAADAPADEG